MSLLERFRNYLDNRPHENDRYGTSDLRFHGKTYQELHQQYDYKSLPQRAKWHIYHEEMRLDILTFTNRFRGYRAPWECAPEYVPAIERVRRLYARGLRKYGIEFMEEMPVDENLYTVANALDRWALDHIRAYRVNMHADISRKVYLPYVEAKGCAPAKAHCNSCTCFQPKRNRPTTYPASHYYLSDGRGSEEPSADTRIERGTN